MDGYRATPGAHANLAAANEPIKAYLAWARRQLDTARSAWFTVTADGSDLADPVPRWERIVCTLEALHEASCLSILLYGDCVELPSSDVRHNGDPVILHRLLMQQLESLKTRIGPRHNAAGSVPLAVRPPPLRPSQASTQSTGRTTQEDDEDEDSDHAVTGAAEEEEEGSSCTLA
jgi:hypothetical protein